MTQAIPEYPAKIIVRQVIETKSFLKRRIDSLMKAFVLMMSALACANIPFNVCAVHLGGGYRSVGRGSI